MKLTTLIENTTCREDLLPEHGLSLLIETGSRKILFDSGQSGAFADNARSLGVSLDDVDAAVLSHGHYDHGGGLPRFLRENGHAPVYVSHLALGDYYHGPEKYIGLAPALKTSPRLIPVKEILELGDGLTLFPGALLPTPRPVRSCGLQILQDGEFLPDAFLHEQYLLLEEKGIRILFSGCSHRGILNIAQYFRPDILVGGFHFMKLDPQGQGRETLEEAACILRELPCTYYTCHCTGVPQYEFLKTILGERLHYLSTGARLSL